MSESSDKYEIGGANHENSENVGESSVSQTIITSTATNIFWEIIKREMGSDVPLYLKHLLTFFGFDSAAAMKNLDDEIINKMEIFARNEMSHMLSPNDKKIDFYNIYWNRPDKFCILPGHKMLLKEIREYIKTHPLSHFIDTTNICSCKQSLRDTKVSEKFTEKNSTDLQFANAHTSNENQELLAEEKQLYSLLKSWYLRQTDPKELFKSFLINPRGKFVKVSIRELQNNKFSYKAKIICNICNAEFAAHKSEYGSKETQPRKTRWIFRNFINHVNDKHLRRNSYHKPILSEVISQPKINDIFSKSNDQIACSSKSSSDFAPLYNSQNNSNTETCSLSQNNEQRKSDLDQSSEYIESTKEEKRLKTRTKKKNKRQKNQRIIIYRDTSDSEYNESNNMNNCTNTINNGETVGAVTEEFINSEINSGFSGEHNLGVI